MTMMEKLGQLDDITSQAFTPSKIFQDGQVKIISSVDKEKCVMNNIIPLKKAILKILLYSDVLAEQKDKSKNQVKNNSLFAYFN